MCAGKRQANLYGHKISGMIISNIWIQLCRNRSEVQNTYGATYKMEQTQITTTVRFCQCSLREQLIKQPEDPSNLEWFIEQYRIEGDEVQELQKSLAFAPIESSKIEIGMVQPCKLKTTFA